MIVDCKGSRYWMIGFLLLSWVLADGVIAEPLDNRRTSDIRNTKHNLGTTPFDSGVSDNRAVQAEVTGGTTQICVFCHTPHAGTQEAGVKAPLWNREFSTATYTQYDSRSIQANIDANPGGSSKLCLSCHDGTLAIDSVNVLNGQANASVAMSGLDAGSTIPGGPYGEGSGFTRRLGTDLRNDHPVSVTYDSQLAQHPESGFCILAENCDGEMYDPALASHIAERVPGARPDVPLEDAKVQCTSCHDPHLRGTGSDQFTNIKFLRLNRFQANFDPGQNFNRDNDMVCLACHDKAGWEDNAHARDETANEVYLDAPAQLREFPVGIKVWQAGCLNCHDPHTVPGARRLLREGVEGSENFQLAQAKGGGNSAIEETCYQCHTSSGRTILSSGNNQAPDIETDFTSAGWRHMPITSMDQQNAAEVHDIKDSDFTEDRDDLGRLQDSKRHVECTDCHNPHRVMKARRFNMDPDAVAGDDVAAGTHEHQSLAAGEEHSNIASGVLRGTWGVEPDYCAPSSSNPTFQSDPLENDQCITFEVKKGDFTTAPGSGGSTNIDEPYVTREYQICLKCHSNYGFGTTPPSLGDSGGGTPINTNGFSSLVPLTNQAMEFRPADPGQPSNATNTGAAATYETNGNLVGNTGNFNHRSWHPVIEATGRTAVVRGGLNVNNWLPPFNRGVGTQTMYCSDCHGSATNNGTAVPPGNSGGGGSGEDGKAWGPHGSSKNFILKGDWDTGTGSGQADDLCFKCHDFNTYPQDGGGRTGFFNDPNDKGRGDLHSYHQDKVGATRCTWCHTAVPHGWKNKALLVNLNDVGPEGGLAVGTEVCTGEGGWGTANCSPGGGTLNNGYDNPPYYLNAFLKVLRFAPSGLWKENDCGAPNNTGRDWMRDAACGNPP